MKYVTAFLIVTALVAAAALIFLPDDPVDRCLDHGGRWNYQRNACECTPEELESPAVAKEVIEYCDKPIPGPGAN